MLFLALALGSLAHAGADSAQTTFTDARAAFDAGDYARALALFEQCVALGMNGPAVHYNIGVAAYRKGDQARAERAFREVAETPSMAALAHYNLGLVELKRDHDKQARSWFERAAREATDEPLRNLAQRRLDDLPPVFVPSWSLYARTGVGYDDNVALRSQSIDSPASGQDDMFGDLLLAGSYTFQPSWRIDAAAGLLRYPTLDEFNQTALSLGVARGISLDAWYFELGAYGARFTLGGDVYEKSLAASVQATRAFSNQQSLRAQLHAASVNGEGDFSGLSGSRTDLALLYDWGWRSWNFGARARAEFNDSEEPVFATRWTELGVEAKWSATPLWSYGGGITWRSTRHPDQPDAGLAAWDDHRTTLRVEVTRTLVKQVQLFLRYEHERNQSPVEVSDYQRNWVSVSVEFWR